MRLILSITALLIASAASASAQFRAVTVDASSIAEQGYPTFARRVEAAVAPAVARVFADQVNPGDPRGLRLVVRVLSVNLPTATYESKGENDDMVTEGLVIDGRGRVVATASVHSPVAAWTASTNAPIEYQEQQRMTQLGLHAAGFLRKNLGSL